MPLPHAVSEAAAGQLPGASPDAAPGPDAVPGATRSTLARKARAGGRRVIRRLLRPAVEPLRQELVTAQRRIDALEGLSRRLAELEIALAQAGQLIASLSSLSVNLELLKAEVRETKVLLGKFAEAVAPGAGIDGVPARFAELRERLNGLERRLRAQLSLAPATASNVGPVESATGVLSANAVTSELFDYVGFEQRFRGDQADVISKLEDRYLQELLSAGPVLDIGCGRGELIALLGEHGVEAYGIDLDANVAAEAKAAGRDVRHEGALEHLEGLAPGSLGAIVSTQVIEHLEFGALLKLLELSASRLRPGGLFIAETPNPGSLIVLSYSYILDPTHVQPLHPALMSFLCETAGFREVRLQFFAPAENLWLEHIEVPDAPEWIGQLNLTLDRLNAFLFGPQDYAVIARTPPARESDTAE
jgi:SAM-dependent methyltransferase